MSSLQLSHTPNQWSEAKSNEETRPSFLRRKTVTFSKVKAAKTGEDKEARKKDVCNATFTSTVPGAHAFAALSKKGLMETL